MTGVAQPPSAVSSSLNKSDHSRGRLCHTPHAALQWFGVAEDLHLQPKHPGKRPPAYSLRALGRKGLPEVVEASDRLLYRLTRTVKHDFWAATGFYVGANGKLAVLKMGRVEPYAGVPLEWAGRFLCWRETRFYQALADLPNVPAVLGTVGRTGFLHEFVPGRPLAKDKPVPDTFFADLQNLISEI